jgi:hypothetical protein
MNNLPERTAGLAGDSFSYPPTMSQEVMLGSRIETNVMMKMFFELAMVSHVPEFALMTDEAKHLTIVGHLVKHCGLKWSNICQIWLNYKFVHPENARELVRADADLENVLAQGFVKSDKLLEILQSVSGKTDVNRLLAVDGMMMANRAHCVLGNGPNFEHRHYLGNLKISSVSERSSFDETPDIKVRHVRAVRLVYAILKRAGIEGDCSRHVYGVMQKLWKHIIHLPGPEAPEVPANVLLECQIAYECSMTNLNMQDVCTILERQVEELSKDGKGDPIRKDSETEKKSEEIKTEM